MPTALDRLPEPQPDVERFKTVLRRGTPDRVPLVELAIAEEVLASLLGRPLIPLPGNPDAAALRRWAGQRVEIWRRLGYDYYRVRAEIPFAVDRLTAAGGGGPDGDQRQWVNERAGALRDRRDLERYPWPARSDIGFAQAEAAVAALPDGMGAIGFSGGVLEWATTLVGLEPFMIGLHDDREFIRGVVDRVGQIVHEAFEVFCEMDRVFALWLGDDLGFKTATLIAPEDLREFILPWHRGYAELAHRSGRFFLLHSCGHVEAVTPDLIRDVGIDAKHSFEDVILPVERFKQRWGAQVAVLGGVDVDLLSRGSPDEVRRRTLSILEACSPGGGYACGSGNSIADYVPPRNYLAMIETIHGFNARI